MKSNKHEVSFMKYRSYVLVWLALIILTGITYGVATSEGMRLNGFAAPIALAWLAAEAAEPGTPVRVRAGHGLFAGRTSGLPFVLGSAGAVDEVPRYPERTPTAT